jgi:hypothetical protein
MEISGMSPLEYTVSPFHDSVVVPWLVRIKQIVGLCCCVDKVGESVLLAREFDGRDITPPVIQFRMLDKVISSPR